MKKAGCVGKSWPTHINKECINEKNGLLVPVENVPALADAMKKMYDTLGEYDSQEIAQDCYNRFSPSVISDKLVDVFQKAVEKKKKMSWRIL